jgi:hypothetical protein
VVKSFRSRRRSKMQNFALNLKSFFKQWWSIGKKKDCFIFDFVWNARITWSWWLSRPSDKIQSEVQCVYVFRTSSTPAVSVRKLQDCENIQQPSCIKGKEKRARSDNSSIFGLI